MKDRHLRILKFLNDHGTVNTFHNLFEYMKSATPELSSGGLKNTLRCLERNDYIVFNTAEIWSSTIVEFGSNKDAKLVTQQTTIDFTGLIDDEKEELGFDLDTGEVN